MEPTTIRLDADELDQIDAEADERGFSNRAEYLRWIIRNRPSVEKDTAESLNDRLSDLEAKVEQLESELDR